MENRLFTKLVILYSMPRAPDEFKIWFKEKAEGRGWKGVREIARGIGLSHPTISEILDGEQPSFDTCLKIADTFAVPRAAVVYMAGLLPPPPGFSAAAEEWAGLIHGEDESIVRRWTAAIRAMKESPEKTGSGRGPKE